ncbi:MAG: TonB-dependent receptor, partial [Tsuneonella sp.]
NRQVFGTLRHDVAGTDWAWGAEANYNHVLPRYRSNSVDRVWEGPVFATVFAENKDVFGLTVRGEVGNIFNARSRRDRTVWTGIRGESPVSFSEQRDRLIGPIFRIAVSGNI